MAKRGPKGPSIHINWVEFEKLCAIHCTLIEISEWFNCSEDTIERHVKKKYQQNFADVFKKKSSRGKISLRRVMFEKALSGNPTMMIWLSKQHLDYRDKVENDTTLTASHELVERVRVKLILPDNGSEAPIDKSE